MSNLGKALWADAYREGLEIALSLYGESLSDYAEELAVELLKQRETIATVEQITDLPYERVREITAEHKLSVF